jgi:hypothetical protein
MMRWNVNQRNSGARSNVTDTETGMETMKGSYTGCKVINRTDWYNSICKVTGYGLDD